MRHWDKEIRAQVMARYPVSEKERSCRSERALMKDKREWLYNKLEQERKNKGNGADQPAVRE